MAVIDYRTTVNLPKTDFPMRANLPKREPEMLALWERMDLYGRLRRERAGKEKWVLHDGPPYASGNAHIGTAMNKVLKDMIVRYTTLSGYDAPYVPGWDTHGMPIEHRVMREGGIDLHSADPLEVRRLCREFAIRNIDAMRKQFERLGVMGDWDHPYRTLDGSFEAEEVRVFGQMAKNGYIFKGLLPVYWCASCETALAEGEIEYAEKESPSIWVAFPVEDGRGLLPEGTRLLIWTTTPWTIPGNQAIAVHPDFTYDLVPAPGGPFVVARDRLADTLAALGTGEPPAAGAPGSPAPLASFRGWELEGVTYRHPLFDRVSPVVLGDHVTDEEGTGLVHTAPGHGHEDFELGKRCGLPIVVPVDAAGRMNELAGPFQGITVDEANRRIPEALAKAGALAGEARIRHQYPHCWRCHSPVLYRATEQWFADIDKMKDAAMRATEAVRWTPSWGERRMKEMVSGRGNWCLSRQRVWGVPIPVFYCEGCGEALLTEASIEAVAELFAREGGDAWWRREPAEILPEGTSCGACGGTSFRKETDIFDVWLDSGCTHAAVLRTRPELKWPADLYLEGHNDQFRGWFQSSLLTSVATTGRAPYEAVLGHGFVVDAEGRHMHKSWGNTVDPMDVVEKYGADVFRLWVMSTDYTADVRIGDVLLEQVADAYRKIRNTARFMLGNLDGFDPARDLDVLEPGGAGSGSTGAARGTSGSESGRRPVPALPDLDAWVLARAAAVQATMRQAAARHDFRAAYIALHNFCVADLSAFYLNARKDALYTAAADAPERRAARAAMWHLVRALAAWVAPVLPFTAEEIWAHVPRAEGDAESVHLLVWPEFPEVDDDAARRVDALLALRDDVAAAVEAARQEGRIRDAAEARVTIALDAERLAPLAAMGEEAVAEALVVAEVRLEEAPGMASAGGRGASIRVEASGYARCDRCWRHVADVGEDPEHPGVCGRCAAVLRSLSGAGGAPRDAR